MSITITDLQTLSRAYAKARGVSLRTASVEILFDRRRLDALENGKDIGFRRLQRAWHWIAENWPEDKAAEWPRDIPRPPSPSTHEATP